MTSTSTQHTDQGQATLADSLRQLAAMVTDHPHLAPDLRTGYSPLLVSVGHRRDMTAREAILAYARVGLAYGATVTEFSDDKWTGVNVEFGPVCLQVYAAVEKVHPTVTHRRSVEHLDEGTRRTVRIVEYTHHPILADLQRDPTDSGDHDG